MSQGRGRIWTAEDDQFIRDNYKKLTDAEMGEELDRTEAAVKTRRYKIGGCLRTNRGREGTRWPIPKSENGIDVDLKNPWDVMPSNLKEGGVRI